MLWILGVALIAFWFVLKVILHKGGYSHILLLTGISLLIIQFAAYRRANYQKNPPGRSGSV
ncbi:MAG: hypothetical protein M3410_06155 [Acidobacteriota bacterium]|nr:hypothetical protein [Acidobacteriota bacterium]